MNDHSRNNGIRSYCCCIILLLIIMGLIPSVTATDTMFRANPEHTGVYDNGGIVPTNAELWRFMRAEMSSPTVANGVVYVGSNDNNLHAIDAVTGKEKWRFVTGNSDSSSPAVSDGVVYIGSVDGNLYAIDALTGKEKWRFMTESLVMSSPTVANGVVYVGSNDNNLYAIDAVTGKEKWRFTTGDWVTSSPAVANGVVYIGSNDNNLYAIDTLTGREKWQFKTRMGVDSSPAVANGVVYIGSNDKNLYAIDALTGKEEWRFVTGGSVTSSPAVYENVIYIGSLDRNLYAIDSETGTEKWRFVTGDPVHSSPALSNSVIYIGSYDTNLYAIDAVTGVEKWCTTGDYISSSPSVSSGIVYTVSGDNTLYAIGGVSSTPITAPTVVSTLRTQSTSPPLSHSPSNSTLSPTSFNPLIIVGVILLLCIVGGGYYVLHSRKPTEDFPEAEPELAQGISPPVAAPVRKSSSESLPLGKSDTILDRITITEKNAMALNMFRAPVDNLLSLSRQYHNLGKYPDADHVLKKAETIIDPLKHCELQLSRWKNHGYDTAPLETLRTDVADKILSKFREFEQGVEQLEKVQNGLDVLKRNYPSIFTQEEFQIQVTSLEQKLKKPDLANILQSEFELLSKNIEQYARVKDLREQHLLSQVKKIQQNISDKSLENEINAILKSIRTGDLPTSEQLFEKLVSSQIARVNDTIISLTRDGVVIPPSITPIKQKPDDKEYGDRIIETSKRLEELDRLRVQFTEATGLKDTVLDTRLLALYEIGEYQQFINKCKIQEHSSRDSIKSQNNRDLIFISSKSEDFDYTQQVYTFLKGRGYNVFFSQQTLPDMGSSDYRKEIDRALDASKHMIVVTSKKEHVESSWVEAEWGLFINEKRSGRKSGNIITLIIGTMRIEDLPSSLRYYEVIPFDPKTFEKILKYLK